MLLLVLLLLVCGPARLLSVTVPHPHRVTVPPRLTVPYGASPQTCEGSSAEDWAKGYEEAEGEWVNPFNQPNQNEVIEAQRKSVVDCLQQSHKTCHKITEDATLEKLAERLIATSVEPLPMKTTKNRSVRLYDVLDIYTVEHVHETEIGVQHVQDLCSTFHREFYLHIEKNNPLIPDGEGENAFFNLVQGGMLGCAANLYVSKTYGVIHLAACMYQLNGHSIVRGFAKDIDNSPSPALSAS